MSCFVFLLKPAGTRSTTLRVAATNDLWRPDQIQNGVPSSFENAESSPSALDVTSVRVIAQSSLDTK